MSNPWDSINVILELGGPYEIMPEQLPKLKELARRYLKAEHPADAKERVAAVWIAGESRPAWQEYHKMPDLRELLHPALRRPQETPEQTETDFG